MKEYSFDTEDEAFSFVENSKDIAYLFYDEVTEQEEVRLDALAFDGRPYN